MVCPICGKRKAKRYCPAKNANICALCCGTEREVTIDCPFDCPYLQEARRHEHTHGLEPKDFPYKDVRIDEGFLHDHEQLLLACGRAVLEGSLDTSGAKDEDVRLALDALIRTYKTLESGIYYESRPDSAFARSVVEQVQQKIQDFRREQSQRAGFSSVRDNDILHVLVFLYRMAIDRDNGRPRGRAFLDFLRMHFGDVGVPASPLIVPGS